MNQRAKFDAASFILGGEIRNRTNTETNTNKITSTSVFGDAYIHTCRSYVRTVAIYCRMQAWPARSPIRPILGFWAIKVLKNVIFPAQDADESLCKISRHFILGGEILNRTKFHTQFKKTVTDIATCCLSACVDKKV